MATGHSPTTQPHRRPATKRGQAAEAKEKKQECLKMQAQKELYIANFYYKHQQYDSALKRYETMLKTFPTVGLGAEALYGAARSAYGRMSNGKPATQALFEDRKLQRELKEAANALRDAGSSLREPPKSARRRRGFGRSLLLLGIGGVLAIALSESLRTKVLDLMFGAEEDFDYSSTTAPETPAPAASVASN